MTTKIGFGLSVLATLALAACGKGSTAQDAKNATNDTVVTDSLMGTYTSTCTNIPGAVLGLSSYNTKYVINGHMDKYTVYYSTNDCQNEVLDIETDGEYSVPGGAANSTALPEKTAEINYTWKHSIVTPKTQALADAMNVANYCGINNWSVQGTAQTPAQRNVDADSGSATCFGTDKLVSIYDLINTQNNQLHFGQSVPLLHDKSSDAQRPVLIDSTVVGTH